MDIFDFAQDLAERDRAGAIQKITNRHRPTTPSATTCQDCGAPIPKARRLAAPGCTRCTPCQSEVD